MYINKLLIMAALANPEPTIRFDPTNVTYVCFRRKNDINGKLGFEFDGKHIWMTSAIIDGEIKNICSLIQSEEDWNVQCIIDENFSEEDLDRYEINGFSRLYVIENVIPIYKPKECIEKLIEKLSILEFAFLIKDIFSKTTDVKEKIKDFFETMSEEFKDSTESESHKQIINILMLHRRERFSELVNFIISKYNERLSSQ